MAHWLIRIWDGVAVKSEHRMPGNLSQKEIEVILQRLVCRDLSVAEVLAASRRKGDTSRTPFLDRVTIDDRVIDYGHSGDHYTAELER